MNYYFLIDNPDGSTLEGWARVSLDMDGDGDFRSLDIEAIEPEPARERHLRIQRGFAPVEDRSPDRGTELRIMAHLVGPALGEIIELWEETEDYRSRGHAWSGMC